MYSIDYRLKKHLQMIAFYFINILHSVPTCFGVRVVHVVLMAVTNNMRGAAGVRNVQA